MDRNKNIITTAQAIKSLDNNAEFSIRENVITWIKGEIPQTEIDAELTRLQAECDAQEYARKREEEYPSIADLVVALYDTNDKSAIETKRAAVKLKYPKP